MPRSRRKNVSGFPPLRVVGDGFAPVRVASRFGTLTLRRQVLEPSDGSTHRIPSNAYLPPHQGIIITRGLQEWACLLPQDLSFFELADERSPWPLRPMMTKEAPVNPDPLYPKNRGYQFKGYQLDDASIPTFLYRTGTIEIEDRAVPTDVGKDNRLRRQWTFQSPRDQTLWFRALTGRIEAESKDRFKTDQIRLFVPPVHAVLRANSADKGTLELLLKFEIPKGISTRTMTYELLK